MDLKETLCRYLDALRDSVVWKVEGVAERDLRMPLTASGTNLLGLVKHLAGLEAEYFGTCLRRPPPEPMPWWDKSAEPDADMWATAEETPERIVALYRDARARADAAIAELPPDAAAHVPWWSPPDTTLHRLLVHMVAETARHAGHMDVLRESLDGQRGMLREVPNLSDVDDAWRRAHVARLRDIAERSGGGVLA